MNVWITSIQPPGLMKMSLGPRDHHHEQQAQPQEGQNSPVAERCAVWAVGIMQDQKQLLSHTDWISALAWHPTSPHNLASASYDGSVKLWDLRSAIPLHTLQGHSDKALCVAWARPEQLVSGGADCKLLTYTVAM